ncbi:MAG TPA: ABC transporter ATP-binding protein [Streptosporangiaceae bacterium]|nr:ABC transporter ATP-binding protein [Streptosporangiaceae bacterium]
MAEIRLQQVSKRYTGKSGDVDALRPLDLQIADGEFITMLGPSGCGKTTLLSIIVGILPPTTGQVLVDGKDLTRADPRNRDMAMVFQNYALYAAKTVRGNLEFPLRMHGVGTTERRRRVSELAEMLGLTSVMSHYPRQLSGGQQQRVALGRALIRRPELFLMDEPLSNLDAKLRLQMRTEIKRLHREFGITTIYVTHDQSEAMALSDRVVVMNRGTVAQVGTPEAIYRYPADQFVADFVGMPPMNIMPVSLRSAGREVECVTGSGRVAARLRPDALPTEAEGHLGVRPSHVRWTRRPPDAAAPWLPATVRQVDPMGEDTLIYALQEGEPVTIMEREPCSVRPGEEIHVAFPAEAAHLFVGGTRQALASDVTAPAASGALATAPAGTAAGTAGTVAGPPGRPGAGAGQR